MGMTMMQIVVVFGLLLLGGIGLWFSRRRADTAPHTQDSLVMVQPRSPSASAPDAVATVARRTVHLHGSDEPDLGMAPNLERGLEPGSAHKEVELNEAGVALALMAEQRQAHAEGQPQHPLDSDDPVLHAAMQEPQQLREQLQTLTSENEALSQELELTRMHVQELERDMQDRGRDVQARAEASERRARVLNAQVSDLSQERDLAIKQSQHFEQLFASAQAMQDEETKSLQGLGERLEQETLARKTAEQRTQSLETTLAERDELVVHQQAGFDERFKVLETRAVNAERDLASLRQTHAEHQEALRTSERARQALEQGSESAARLQSELAEAELALATATMEHEHALRSLREDATSAQQSAADAQARIQSLEQQIDNDAAAAERADKAVEHALALEAEKTRLAEALAEMGSALQRATQESSSVEDLSRELKNSQQRAKQLNSALEDAQRKLNAAGETDLELRRAKSELAALEARLAKAAEAPSPTHAPAADSRSAAPAKVQDDKVASNQKKRRPLYKRPATRDDLKQIWGIGPVMEGVLNELGVTTFAQIANFSRDDVERVAAAIDTFPDRIERDDWIGGARALCKTPQRELADA